MRDNNTIDAVLLYIASGIPVFPLSGKRPIYDGGFKLATTDREKVLEWHRENPGCNWGMPTGQASGFDVLDIDGEEGRESLREWLGTDHAIPTTPTQETGSGGFHFLFKADPRVRNSAKAMKKGWDTRGDGGYIVIAPSIHPTTGEPYKWLHSPLDTPPIPWPDDLMELYTASRREEREKMDTTEKIPWGRQEDTLTRYAGKMVRESFTPEEILAALLEMGRNRCDPPMPDENIQRIAESVSRYAPGDPLETIEMTDRGWGMRFGEFGRHAARYVLEAQDWSAYDGQRWHGDGELAAQRVLDQLVDTMVARATAMPAHTDEDLERKERYLGYALQGRSDRTFGITMRQARRFSTASKLDFDTNPSLFNVANGTIDLTSGRLLPHNPRDFITKLSPVAYNPSAKSLEWQAFLATVTEGDTAYQEYLQRVVGYTMLGKTEEQLLMLIYGEAATGKSTFLNVISHVFGEYASVASTGAFLSRKEAHGPRPELVKFMGARMVTGIEIEEGRKLDEAMVKTMTGNEEISVRGLYEKEVTFLPQFTIWLASNDLPEVTASDSMFRRIKNVPFDHIIPAEKRDRELGKRLMSGEHAEAILTWCVEGALAYQAHGIQEHERVTSATQSYREDMDVVGQFIASQCDTDDPEAWVPRDALWASFKNWCQAVGFQYTTNRKLFGEVRSHGYKDAKRGPMGEQVRVFLGLKMKNTTPMSMGKMFGADQ